MNVNPSQIQGQHQLPAEGFVRLPQVLAVLPVSRSAFLKRVKEGAYPAPVKIGGRTVAWRVQDVRALLEKIAA